MPSPQAAASQADHAPLDPVALGLPPDPSEWTAKQTARFAGLVNGLPDQAAPVSMTLGLKPDPSERTDAERGLSSLAYDLWRPVPAKGGAVSTTDGNTGKVTVTTAEEIDLMEDFDKASPGSEAAIAIAAKLRQFDEAVSRPVGPTTPSTTRDRAPRLQSIGVRRRTCAGGRRRPGARRVVRSSSGAASTGEPSDSDGPGEKPRRVVLLAAHERRQVEILSRIGPVAT
jgi:hypothetical protein